jgi:uncharacterized protein YggT (Ycf19 family)
MGRLRPADVLAGAAGVALLVVLFLPWYQPRGVAATGGATAYAPLGRLSAWQAFSVIDVLLALAALIAIALVVVTAVASGPAKPVAFTVMSTVASTIAVLLALFRALVPPHGYLERCYGVWLGLGVTVLMLAFSFLAMKDDRTPGAVPPDVPRRPLPPA